MYCIISRHSLDSIYVHVEESKIEIIITLLKGFRNTEIACNLEISIPLYMFYFYFGSLTKYVLSQNSQEFNPKSGMKIGPICTMLA